MTDTLVLDDFVLLDGTGRPPRAGARVVLEENLIASVNGGSPSGAEVVEGRGRWLVPGLWDTHIHHVFSAGGFVRPEEFSQEQRDATWRAYLGCGVTSVVSVGDDKSIILAARAAERDDTLVAPRVFASGTILTAPGGHPITTILHGEVSRFSDVAVGVGDPSDGRRRVRGLIEDDAVDLIKVVYSNVPGDVPRLARDVLDAVVDEAHTVGRPVTAHVSTPEDAAHCVAAGVDGLEHMVLAGAEALDDVFVTARQQGVVWTPTLSLFDKMAHDGDQRYIEDYRPEGFVSQTVLQSLTDPAAWWRQPDPGAPRPPWSRTLELTGRAHAAGVRLSLGTDAGNPAVFHGLAVHRELELLVRSGLTPLEALTAATGYAAAKVRADARLGTIEPGKEADLVVLRESPLEDIRNSRLIDMVIKRGRCFDPVALTVR